MEAMIPEDLKTWLVEQAAYNGVSVAFEVRRAIERYRDQVFRGELRTMKKQRRKEGEK